MIGDNQDGICADLPKSTKHKSFISGFVTSVEAHPTLLTIPFGTFT